MLFLGIDQHARQITISLRDETGVIFANGYYLQTGEHKTFETELQGLLFERRIPSSNGEDYLYVFYNRREGVYVLLLYNLIEQKVGTPIITVDSGSWSRTVSTSKRVRKRISQPLIMAQPAATKSPCTSPTAEWIP